MYNKKQFRKGTIVPVFNFAHYHYKPDDLFVTAIQNDLKNHSDKQIQEGIIRSKAFVSDNQKFKKQKEDMDSDLQQGFTLSPANQRKYTSLVTCSRAMTLHSLYLEVAKNFLYRRANPEIQLENLPKDILNYLLAKLDLFGILQGVVRVSKKFYDFVYLNTGSLHEAQLTLQNPIHCQPELICQINCINQYVHDIYDQQLVICVGDSLTELKVKRDILAKKSHIGMYGYNERGNYISFVQFKQLIELVSKKINILHQKMSVEFKTYSAVSKLANHLNCGEFADENAPNSFEDFQQECRKHIYCEFDNDIPIKWVEARREMLIECWNYFSQFWSQFTPYISMWSLILTQPLSIPVVCRQISTVIEIIKNTHSQLYQNGCDRTKDKCEIIDEGITLITQGLEMASNNESMKLLIQATMKLLIITGQTVFHDHTDFDQIAHLNHRGDSPIRSRNDSDDYDEIMRKQDDEIARKEYEDEKYMWSYEKRLMTAKQYSKKYSKTLEIDYKALNILPLKDFSDSSDDDWYCGWD